MMHAKSIEILQQAQAILSAYHPMTLRQLYYQLVTRQAIENTRSSYASLSKLIVKARQEEIIPWSWIEDRTRKPRHLQMWKDIYDYPDDVVASYHRNIWQTQPTYFEFWLEKDALSGIFEDVLSDYGITLNVGRGYDGWSSIRNAAARFGDGDGVTILYYGDFDPSGEDMVRSLRERLAFFNCYPEIIKVALTKDDVIRYNLPPDYTKKTDTRSAAFVDKYGDMAVELDALPADVLETSIRNTAEAHLDLDALARTHVSEQHDKELLRDMFEEYLQ